MGFLNVELPCRPRTKKRLIYPGKTLAKKKKKKVLSNLERVTKDEKTSPESIVPDDLEAERIVRKSTRTSVIVRQAERDAIRAALQATMKVSSEFQNIPSFNLFSCTWSILLRLCTCWSELMGFDEKHIYLSGKWQWIVVFITLQWEKSWSNPKRISMIGFIWSPLCFFDR